MMLNKPSFFVVVVVFVCEQFHSDYLKESRSFLWEVCIEPLLEGPDPNEEQ